MRPKAKRRRQKQEGFTCSTRELVALWIVTSILVGSTAFGVTQGLAQGRTTHIPLYLVAVEIVCLTLSVLATVVWRRSRPISSRRTGIDADAAKK